MANAKYNFFKRWKDSDQAIQQLVRTVIDQYKNKYYNVWMSRFEWNGLDEDLKEQEENYIMRRFWSDGSLALRNIANTGMLALAPFATVSYNFLDFPDTVTLVNKRGVSEQIIPSGEQIVNKDCAIAYCLPNHKSIEYIVNFYIDRISQAEVLINNNLKLQNMPFVIGVDEKDKSQFEDIVTRILNNELIVFTNVGDLNKLQTLTTSSPYIVDKLKQYEVSLENELLTILGINNSGSQAKKAQMLVDEVNSMKDVINDFGQCIIDEITHWLNRANKVLGRNISIKAKAEPTYVDNDYEDAGISAQKGDEPDEDVL